MTLQKSVDTLSARLEAPAWVALRVVSGALFAFHGLQKTFGIMSPQQPPLFSQMGVGGVIELVCGVLIAVGFGTRAAAFLASGTMAVAYFQFHWKLELAGGKWIPAINKGELAVLYCFVFLFIAMRPASGTRRRA